MRKIFPLLLILFSAASFNACKKDGIQVKFKLNYDVDFTIESGNILNLPFDVFTPEVTTNSEGEFEANDTRKDKVESIKLNFIDLEITAPQGETFSFLKHVYLYINADGLDEKRIAYKENIDNSTSTISLDIEDVELADYIKKDSYSLRVESVTDEQLSQDVDVHADLQFQVKARAL